MSESRTFPTCTRGDKPHPDVPAGTLLALVEGSRDELGRERFSLVWYEPDREGRVERIAERPGGPSRPVALCGHRAQCFHAKLDPYVQRAEDRGERVVVEASPGAAPVSWNAARLHGDPARAIVIVGLAPARTSEPGSPALASTARTGRRLEDLLGRPVLEVARTTNVLPRHDHPIRGDAARRLGEELRVLLERDRPAYTVVLGMDAARLMGLRWGHAKADLWFRWEWDCTRPGGIYYAVAPHPSGLSHWWNDPANVERARAFFADLLARAERVTR